VDPVKTINPAGRSDSIALKSIISLGSPFSNMPSPVL